ncbi:MAG: hypothetical protein V2A34_03100 [Lentisphaerota bacterium]
MKHSINMILGGVAVLLMSQTLPVWAQEEIIVKAYVDGPSELVITTNGFQWKNGMNAKPGRLDGRTEDTYINGKVWTPQWTKQTEDRGADTSQVFPWKIESPDLDFELLAIGDSPDVTTIEPRTAPTISYTQGAMIINIPDPEPAAKWYVFALIHRS